ncbi:unnamed protein product [Discula destructiva]
MPKFERKEKSQPKHKPTASSGASKAPRPPPVQQPGWKGPTYIHKKPARPKAPASATGSSNDPGPPRSQPQPLPAELQQLVLDVFRDTLPASLDFDALKPTLHEINAALAARDLAAALGAEVLREAYAIRWSPSRALCYANLLADIVSSAEAGRWVEAFFSGGGVGGGGRSAARAVCIGGGAAEVVAFGALMRQLKPEARGRSSSTSGIATATAAHQPQVSTSTATVIEGEDVGQSQPAPPSSLSLTLVDTTDWASVVAKLERGLTTAPVLSKYASAAARENNAPLLAAEALRVTVAHKDVLVSSNVDDLRSLVGPEAALITFFFTLHELYTTSIAKTTKLLVEMTLAAPRHSLLLVVDSPGCCVETSTGGKGYSMAWLMDHLLLDKGRKKGEYEEEGEDEDEQKGGNPAWEKLVGDECRLFRMKERLEYPASLENTRFQVHLFRRS